jgi:hypothetical protein
MLVGYETGELEKIGSWRYKYSSTPINGIQVTPDSKKVIILSEEGIIKIDPKDGSEVGFYQPKKDGDKFIDFSVQNNKIFALTEGGEIYKF